MSILGIATLTTEADLSGLHKGLNQAEADTKGVFGGLASLGKGLLVAGIAGATAAIGALGAGLGYALSEAMEAEQGLAQLDAVLKSTGGAAGVTRDQAIGLADSLSEITRFSDDAILSGENLLLTFTGIGEDIFPQVVSTMLDMSTAMGQDLTSSATMLGKALNDPSQGLSALTRVGVVFTDEQKTMVEAMMAAGDVAGAQAIILAELQKEFGGSAEAAGATFGGQLDILKNSLSNVAESIGMSFLPLLKDLTAFVTANVLPWIQAVGEKFAFLLGIVQDQGLGGLFTVFEDGSSYLGSFFETLGFGEGQANALGAAMSNFGTWVIDTLIPGMMDLAGWLGTNIPLALQSLSALWTENLLPSIQGVWGWLQVNLFPLLSQLWNILSVEGATSIGLLREAWTNQLLPDLQAAGLWIQENLFPIFQGLWDWFATNLPPVIQALAGFWNSTLLPAVITFSDWYRDTAAPVLAELFTWLQDNIPVAIQTLSDFWTGTLQPALITVGDWVTSTLLPLLSELWTWLSDSLTTAIETLSGFWTNTLVPALEAAWGFFNEYILPVIQDVIDIAAKLGEIALTALAGFWENVLQPALETVWEYLSQNILPIFEDIRDFIADEIGPKILWFKTEVIDPLTEALVTGLQAALTWVHEKLVALGQFLDNFTLPDWLTPGSPTPFEVGLLGIADALDTVTGRLRNMAAALSGGLLSGVEDDLAGILKVANKVSGLGSTFAGIFAQQNLTPLLEDIDILEGAINKGLSGLGEELDIENLNLFQLRELLNFDKLNPENNILSDRQEETARNLLIFEEERARVAAEIAAEEERILKLQEKQQQLDFLNAQLDLLKLATEAGLDTSIFEGMLGLDADPAALTDLMEQVLQALIDQANQTLETGSPSKVFTRIGESIPDGLESALYAGIGDVSDAMSSITDELYSPAMDGQLPDTSTVAGYTPRGEPYVTSGATYQVNMAGAIIMSQQEAERMMQKTLEKTGARADVYRRGG